jgi:hypothetical protein
MRLYRRCTSAGSALSKGELSYVAKTVAVNSLSGREGRTRASCVDACHLLVLERKNLPLKAA